MFHEPFTLPLMNESYFAAHVPLEGSNRLPLYTQYVILPLLVTACLVALRPGWPIRVAVVLLHVSWTFNAATSSVGGGFEAWLKGSFLGLITLVTFYDMVLADPLAEWRHHSRPGVCLADLSLWERVYWVLCAAVNSRGIGWSFEVPYIPPLPSYERWPFMRRRIRQLLWNMFLVDIAQTYQRLNPLFAPGSTASMWSQGLVFGYLNLLARLIVAWAIFNLLYCWLSLALVGSGIHEPKDWPDTFGDWSNAYTVRRFWSRSYHQRLRRYTATTGKSAARFFGCKPGTWLSARVQLVFGFGISALAHLPGDLMVGRQCAGATAPFFLWQIIAITFEDFVIVVGRNHGVEEGFATHIVGWIWTFGWFVIMTTKFFEWTFTAGAGMHETMKFSGIRPMLDVVGKMSGTNITEYLTSAIPNV